MSELSTLAAFASLGILSLPHCILMCGPIAARACAGPSGVSKSSGFGYVVGRTTSYIFIGATAGTVGAALLSEAGRSASIILIEFAALILFVQGVHRLLPRLSLAAFARGRNHVVGRFLGRILAMLPTGGLPLGLATGFLPCGALAAALALAAATGHPVLGAAGMAVFSLAGAPVLILPLLLAARRSNATSTRAISLSRWAGAAMVVLAVGIAVRPFTDRLASSPDDHCAAAPASVSSQ